MLRDSLIASPQHHLDRIAGCARVIFEYYSENTLERSSGARYGTLYGAHRGLKVEQVTLSGWLG